METYAFNGILQIVMRYAMYIKNIIKNNTKKHYLLHILYISKLHLFFK